MPAGVNRCGEEEGGYQEEYFDQGTPAVDAIVVGVDMCGGVSAI